MTEAPLSSVPELPADLPAHALRGLNLREFHNYPDLAAWCRERVPAAQKPRFAMGHGMVFVELVGFMRAHPKRTLSLLVFSRPSNPDRAERVAYVFACVKNLTAAAAPTSANAVLLYEGPAGV